MKLLIDTNIILEVVLEQTQASEVRDLLGRVEEHQFFMTDYSLHSIGLLLFRRGLHDVFRQIIEDIFLRDAVGLASLQAENLVAVVEVAKKFSLDFDDAYQYLVARRHDMHLVSFDSDFDRTDRGQKTPAELIA